MMVEIQFVFDRFIYTVAIWNSFSALVIKMNVVRILSLIFFLTSNQTAGELLFEHITNWITLNWLEWAIQYISAIQAIDAIKSM